MSHNAKFFGGGVAVHRVVAAGLLGVVLNEKSIKRVKHLHPPAANSSMQSTSAAHSGDQPIHYSTDEKCKLTYISVFIAGDNEERFNVVVS